ncbi:MAG: hypothetical protein OXG16_00325 [Rhodospirillales bacterium]|nr:hypothetical protein [Rhodospirillales bacterium]
MMILLYRLVHGSSGETGGSLVSETAISCKRRARVAKHGRPVVGGWCDRYHRGEFLAAIRLATWAGVLANEGDRADWSVPSAYGVGNRRPASAFTASVRGIDGLIHRP